MIASRILFCLLIVASSAHAAEPIELRAGRVSMLFEPDNAFVRYVRVDDHKVLQGLSAPVRDRFWGTVPPEVTNVRVEKSGGGFRLTYDVACRQGDIDFSWRGAIDGDKTGTVTFSFDGQSNSDFLRNRIGFCVLHGPEAAGKRCVVETVAGEKEPGRFPEFIAPHQPFKNIRAISHELADGVWATVTMTGDTWEMEDQRNWTDASFKTYCTPLEIPYPVKVAQGDKVAQRIEISFEGLDKLPAPERASGDAVTISVAEGDDTQHPLPGIGLQTSSEANQLTDAEIARLKELRLDHLRVDVTPFEKTATAKLKSAAEQAKKLGVELYVGLHLGKSGEGELATLSPVLAEISPPATWLLIAADEKQVRAAREFLSRKGQTGKLGRGEDTNFTELNRQRPDPATIDVVSFGLNPQIHAFDNTSIVETLEIQGDTVESAKQFVGDRPLVISPITLKKQALDAPPAKGELPANVDPRQTSPFAAGWTLGSIKYLAEAGADKMTYFETVGWRGIMESEGGLPLPDRFPSRPGQLFPIYHALHELAPFAGGHVRETSSDNPMAVVGLAVETHRHRRLFVVNLTSKEQLTRVLGFGDRVSIRLLGENGFAAAVESEGAGVLLKLPAHGIASIEPR